MLCRLPVQINREDFMVCFQNLLNQFDKEETTISTVAINLRNEVQTNECCHKGSKKKMFVIDSFNNQVKRVKLV